MPLLDFYYAPEYKEKSGLLLFNLFLWALLIITCCAVIFWRVSEYLAGILLQDRNLGHLLKIYALILFLQPFSSLFLCLLRMLERAKYFIFTSISSALLSAGLTLYLLTVLKKGVLALIVGNLFGLIVTVIMIFPVFIKRSTFKLSRSVLIPPLKYAYPLLLSEYSNLLIQSGDRYVLRIFNSVSVVGLYSFGYQIAGILQIALVTPLKQALQPVVLKQEEDPEAIRDFLRVGATYFYLIGCAACLLISLFSREILTLFARNEAFWEAWIIVPIITYSYVQHGVGNFVGWGMGLMKKIVPCFRNSVDSGIGQYWIKLSLCSSMGHVRGCICYHAILHCVELLESILFSKNSIISTLRLEDFYISQASDSDSTGCLCWLPIAAL